MNAEFTYVPNTIYGESCRIGYKCYNAASHLTLTVFCAGTMSVTTLNPALTETVIDTSDITHAIDQSDTVLEATFTLTETIGSETHTDVVTRAVAVASPPKITITECYRCNSNGTRNDNGDHVKATISVEPNDHTYTVKWRSKAESAASYGGWHVVTTFSGSITIVLSETFSVSEAHKIEFGVVSTHGFEGYTVYRIPQTDVMVHFDKSGTAIGVGTKANSSIPYSVMLGWSIIGKYADDVLDFAESCAQGITPFTTDGSTANIPSSNYANTHGIAVVGSSKKIYLFGNDGAIAVNTYSSSWTGWKYLTPQ